MPVVVGKYWIQANARFHSIFSLDVRDLTNVRLVSTITLDDRQRPHWLATDGNAVPHGTVFGWQRSASP